MTEQRSTLMRFFAWLGASENKDHKLVSALADCMRFLTVAFVVGAVAGVVSYTGADDFGSGEARSSLITGVLGALGARLLKG